MKAYCVKCKATREIKDPKKKETKNGRWMMQGECPHCGTKMSVFIKGGDKDDDKKDDKKEDKKKKKGGDDKKDDDKK
jgi:hypothetical protein